MTEEDWKHAWIGFLCTGNSVWDLIHTLVPELSGGMQRGWKQEVQDFKNIVRDRPTEVFGLDSDPETWTETLSWWVENGREIEQEQMRIIKG